MLEYTIKTRLMMPSLDFYAFKNQTNRSLL